MSRRSWRVALLAVAALFGADACGEDAERPPTVVPDRDPTPVSAEFSVTLDLGHAALSEAVHPTLEPSPDPVTIRGGSEQLALRAFAKRVVHRPGLAWIDVFLENRADAALRDVVLEVNGAPQLHDWTRDPFAGATEQRRISVGPIASGGLGHVVLGLPAGGVQSLAVVARAIMTLRGPTSSATLAVAPDGFEAWIPFADADTVAVVDTRTDARVANVPVPGRPSSVAVTPDGALVLVTSAAANTVSVIDRRSRRVLQTLGESDGIGREPRNVVLTPDGGRAFVSAYVGDTVTSLVRNDDHYRVELAAQIGRRPTGMAVTADGKALLVAHHLPRGPVTGNEAWISVLSTAPLAMVKEVPIHDHFNVDRARCIADVFHVSPERMTTEGTATQLAGVFLAPSGGEAWVPGTRVAGAALVWERGPKVAPELTSLAAIRPGELLPPFVFVFDARDSKDVDRLIAPGGVERPVATEYLSCARYQTELEWVGRDLVPSAPGEQVNRFLAFPSGISGLSESGLARAIAFTRGGRRALVLSTLADEILVVDAATHHPASQLHFTLSGSNPTGIVVTPDGKKAYVSYASSTFASVLDLGALDHAAAKGPSFVPYAYREVKDVPQVGLAFGAKHLVRNIAGVPARPPLREIAQVALLDRDPVDPLLRRGQVLFNSSNPDKWPSITRSRLGACAACHPDGGTDGSMWATMEGERRTMSLRGGVEGRGWLHASATHRDAEEFVATVVRERLGGDLSGDDVRALAAYVRRGIPRLQSPRVDAARAEKGARVFARRCATCHSADKGRPGEGGSREPQLFDVRTAVDDAHVALSPFFESLLTKREATILHLLRGDRALGPGDPVAEALDFRQRPARARGMFKAPSLVNAWDTPLYFHDGRFQSLEDAVGYMNQQLGLDLSQDDIASVIEHLKTL
jgi:YVTN family beta-propeller protein